MRCSTPNIAHNWLPRTSRNCIILVRSLVPKIPLQLTIFGLCTQQFHNRFGWWRQGTSTRPSSVR